MDFGQRLRPTTILLALVCAHFALWLIVLHSGNIHASSLMHHYTYIGGWYYQTDFDIVPNWAYAFPLNQGFYHISAWSIKLFGSTFWAYVYPNGIGLLAIILAAFFIGQDLRSPMAGLFCAASTAAMPAVSGLAQAYEGHCIEMAALMMFFLFFMRFIRGKGFLYLLLALGMATLAEWVGSMLTFQTLAIFHVGLYMLATIALIRTLPSEEKSSLVKNIRPWLGSGIIIAGGTTMFVILSSLGIGFEYHFSEIQRVSEELPRSWFWDLPYYPLHAMFQYMNIPALALVILGLIFGRGNKWTLIILGLLILTPMVLLTPVRKLDAAYTIDTVPAICIFTGLCAERLFTQGKLQSIVTVALLALMTVTVFYQSFDGRKEGFYFYSKALEERPEYRFIHGAEWADYTEYLDRRSDCIAHYSQKVCGENRFCFVQVMPTPKLEALEFRARIVIEDPNIYPFFTTDPWNDVRNGEPELSDFNLYVFLLDNETAKLKTLEEKLAVAKSRAEYDIATKRYEKMIKNVDNFHYIGRGCGIEFYILKKQ